MTVYTLQMTLMYTLDMILMYILEMTLMYTLEMILMNTDIDWHAVVHDKPCTRYSNIRRPSLPHRLHQAAFNITIKDYSHILFN